MEGENKKTKITSVEKKKVKDPRRVEQGKMLAAISREAKERKARDLAQREQRRLKEEAEGESISPYVFVIPAIGIAVGEYYLLYLRRSNDRKGGEEPPEDRTGEEPRKRKPNLDKL